MSSNNSLSDIPITVTNPGSDFSFHWRRRLTQYLFLALIIIIPVSGLLRIDLVAGAFVVLDRQIWWADFFIVFGLWILIASSAVLIYSTVGTAFCGWVCPQNTMSELANHLTYLFLGKRADLSVSGEKMKVASRKDRWLNWLVLGIIFTFMAMVLALIPLLYFYPPGVVWSFITFRDDARLADSLHFIYTIFVLVFLVDVAFIRHFWCRFMCVYRVWQHGFKTQQTLRIDYDDSRSESCEKCNFCNTVCFLGIDPRNTDTYDSCINCGECIDACNQVQSKLGESSLLSFASGAITIDESNGVARNLASMSQRISWTMPFSLLGLGMFVYGLVTYEYYHLAVYRADINHGVMIQDYRISVYNKLYQDAKLTVSIKGLDKSSYSLSESELNFTTATRKDLNIHINTTLSPGLYRFIVDVQSEDGWHKTYRVQHFVQKDMGRPKVL